MSNFRVAVVQGSSEGLDCKANLEKGLAYCGRRPKRSLTSFYFQSYGALDTGLPDLVPAKK